MVTCTESNSTHPGGTRAKLEAPNNPSQAESVSLGTEPGRTVQLERVSVKLGRFFGVLYMLRACFIVFLLYLSRSCLYGSLSLISSTFFSLCSLLRFVILYYSPVVLV